jgi:4-hydroxy-4-methyl-2-oxoglutarate aldolase|nr:Methyltransferase [Aeromicrobium sp.]
MATEEELAEVRPRLLGMIDESRIVTTRVARPSPEVVAGFHSITDLCSTVSDALDELGVGGAIPASRFSPVVSGGRVCGPAITLRYAPVGGSPGAHYGRKERALLADRDLYGVGQAGDVAVFQGGSPDVSVMGGLSATWAKGAGIAACIVDGGVRDVGTIRELEHLVWSAGRTPITGRHRLEAVEINGTVTIGDVQVRPGDLIVGDDTGVCVVPHAVIDDVLERCLAGEQAESTVLTMLRDGRPVSDIVATLPAELW